MRETVSNLHIEHLHGDRQFSSCFCPSYQDWRPLTFARSGARIQMDVPSPQAHPLLVRPQLRPLLREFLPPACRCTTHGLLFSSPSSHPLGHPWGPGLHTLVVDRNSGTWAPEKDSLRPQKCSQALWEGNFGVLVFRMWFRKRAPPAWRAHGSLALWPSPSWGGSWPEGTLGPAVLV